MKMTTILSTSSLALLVSMNVSYASLSGDEGEFAEGTTGIIIPALVEDDGFAAALAAAHKSRKWGDVDGDGDRDFKDLKLWLKGKLDFDGDGDVDWGDIIAKAKSLFDKVHEIFDADGDGDVEFDEILIGTHNALGKIMELSIRVLEISGSVQDSPYFEFIPDRVKNPLQDLLDIVDKAAEDTQNGINIGDKYVGRIEKALKSLKSQVKHLTDGDMSAENIIKARKDIFAYLEMVKGWYNTGDNTALITRIEEKLAKIEVPQA